MWFKTEELNYESFLLDCVKFLSSQAGGAVDCILLSTTLSGKRERMVEIVVREQRNEFDKQFAFSKGLGVVGVKCWLAGRERLRDL